MELLPRNLISGNFPPTVPENLVGCEGETSGFAFSEERGFCVECQLGNTGSRKN
jgi:hypothetical protein